MQSVVAVRSRISELYRQFEEYPTSISRGMKGLIYRTKTHVSSMFTPSVRKLEYSISSIINEISFNSTLKLFDRSIWNTSRVIGLVEKIISSNNPERQLKLGYSIAKAISVNVDDTDGYPLEKYLKLEEEFVKQKKAENPHYREPVKKNVPYHDRFIDHPDRPMRYRD